MNNERPRKRHVAIEPSKAKILFFDLEFYVPPKNRKETGFNYNPAVDENMLLGGVFYPANPAKDLLPHVPFNSNKLKNFWLWEYQAEKKLLQAIYTYLKEIESQVYKHFQGIVSPVVCGIGISNSDIPVLFHLLNKHSIDTAPKLFELQNTLRVLDLSQLSIGTFNKKDHFLYPKTKNEILSKYLHGKRMESGKSIWELYETHEFCKIESRVVDEVNLTVSCYKAIKQNFDFFKQLESEYKKQIKNSSPKKL